jgi:integrase
MEWGEIDWQKSLWEISASKMKMPDPHVVPLAAQSFGILRGIRPLMGGGRYLFPTTRKGGRSLNANSVRTLQRS